MRKTREEMRADTNSAMWEKYTPETVTGLTAFEYSDTDEAAKRVVDWYIKHLAIGVTNIANVFRPEVVMFGGGVSGQKERLTLHNSCGGNAAIYSVTCLRYRPVRYVR